MGSRFDTLDELAESLVEGMFEPALVAGEQLPVNLGFRSEMQPRTPRQLGRAASIGSPAARRARKVAEPAAATEAKTPLVLSEMPTDALDKIVSRLDSPDMVSLCCTCKATQRAVSADWLWREALTRDFPERCARKLCISQSEHPQRVYAAIFSQTIDLTRAKTRARFEPEKIQSNSFIFTLPTLDGSNTLDGDDNVAIPQPVSHIVLAKAIEGLARHVDRVRAQSFNLGFLAHGLATLEGIRCATRLRPCLSSRSIITTRCATPASVSWMRYTSCSTKAIQRTTGTCGCKLFACCATLGWTS